MTGWIVRNRISANDADFGEILGQDGLIYTFSFAEHSKAFSELDLKTYVSFSPLSDIKDPYRVTLEAVLTQTREEEIARLDKEAEAFLSPKRYLHTFRVAKIARALAERFGTSPEKAEIAGLVHDAAKENTMEENRRLIREAGIPLAGFELNEHSILHAAAGAVVAASRLGITDRDVLDAVRYHNGRPAMKDLEKIIFLADHLDYIYKNRVRSGNDIIQEKDLDSAIFKMFTVINQVLVRGGSSTDTITESTMNYMFVKLNEAADAADPTPDSTTSLSDTLFDRALEINTQRGIPLRSVKNIRELGGCPLQDGRHVRRGMLIRSARLSDLTEEDADKLADFGITAIIDLRTEEEIAKEPDRNTERFCRICCPLPTLELTEYQKNVQEKFFLTSPGAEKAYYLSEYLNCISMKELYLRILTEEGSIENLRRFFAILCSPEPGGFLFHCSDGKDRSGIAAALFLLALGAAENDIFEDYYTSALSKFSETEAFAQSLRIQHYSAEYIDEIRYCNGIGMNIAESVRDTLKDRFGSVRNYLERFLLSAEQLSRLREKFTE